MGPLHGRTLAALALLFVAGSAAAQPTVGHPSPIDLATTLRLADADNPTVAIARARYREALARQQQAGVAWLPDLSLGTAFLRHDGQIQNSRGEVFTISRQSLFAGGGPQLSFETADALYLPLVARRLTAAAAANARATSNNVQLDAALAYLDLMEVYGRLAINTDTLARAEQVLRAAQAGVRAGVNRSTADVKRAATEVGLRRQERIDLQSLAAVASARLARLLLLDPTVDLLPVDRAVVPVILVPPSPSLNDLVQVALRNRPEVASARATADAAGVRVRQAQYGPLLPRVQLDYLGGTFGGGPNDALTNFNARGDFTGQVYWNLHNLGLGNRYQVRERQAQAQQAGLLVVDAQAQVAAEVTVAAKTANFHYFALQDAQDTVRQAVEMYRRLAESSFGMANPRPLFEALEPLTAVQALNQARVQYLSEVIAFNRAELQLFTALGQPAVCALPGAAQPPAVPAVPSLPPKLPHPGGRP